jgi:sugar phosphate permease
MSTGPGQFAFGALGLFMIPLGEEFGWSRTEISLALSFFTLSLACSIPFVGRWVDRVGSRRVLLPSLTIFAILLALIPVLVSQLWILFVLFTLIGCLAAGANALPYLRTVSSWFDRRRGLAIGIAMGGSGMGFVYVPPTIQYVIDNYGWRQGYFTLAIVAFVVAVPLVYFLLREAPSKEEMAHCDEHQDPGEGVATPAHIPLPVLLKQPLLWQLFFVFTLLSFCLYGVMSHLVPMLRDRGMASGDAALVQATLGAAVVVSRIFIGFAIDRYFAPRVAVICFIVSALGVGLLASGAVGTPALLGAACIGLSMGAEIDMLAYLTGRYFGLENFGQVYGILFVSFLLGTSIGPVAYGMAYETMGSYLAVLNVSIALMLISAVATALLPRYAMGRQP